jgi:hypothetical protein
LKNRYTDIGVTLQNIFSKSFVRREFFREGRNLLLQGHFHFSIDMQTAVSWDLLVIVFFIIIMSYSYIVGSNGTAKIILASYVGMLAANGIGNLFAKSIHLSAPLIKIVETSADENVIIFKLFMFIVITLLLVLKGGFLVEVGRFNSWPLRMGITTVLGFLSAGLIMSTVLVFIAGGKVDSFLVSSLQEGVDIPATTVFVRSMLQYYNLWFAAPAVVFSLLSVFNVSVPPVSSGQE